MTSQTLQMTVIKPKIENISENIGNNDIQTWHELCTSDKAQSDTINMLPWQHSHLESLPAMNQIS